MTSFGYIIGLHYSVSFYSIAFIANLASAVSSALKFLDARNLTCLQPLSNGLYTSNNSLKHRSFRSVWTQKQNKSRCILGAFIVPLSGHNF